MKIDLLRLFIGMVFSDGVWRMGFRGNCSGLCSTCIDICMSRYDEFLRRKVLVFPAVSLRQVLSETQSERRPSIVRASLSAAHHLCTKRTASRISIMKTRLDQVRTNLSFRATVIVLHTIVRPAELAAPKAKQATRLARPPALQTIPMNALRLRISPDSHLRFMCNKREE